MITYGMEYSRCPKHLPDY